VALLKSCESAENRSKAGVAKASVCRRKHLGYESVGVINVAKWLNEINSAKKYLQYLCIYSIIDWRKTQAMAILFSMTAASVFWQ
jgi:hypothetical protein